MRRGSPAMLRCTARGTACAARSPLPHLRGLRTVTHFREEDRPDAQTKEQQQQQQQAPKQQQQQAAPAPAQEQQQMQQMQGEGEGEMVARRRPEEMGLMGDMVLPPSFRRFNETLNQMQREMVSGTHCCGERGRAGAGRRGGDVD